MTQILWLAIQIGLLVAWFTVAPGLPWWLVFLPLLISGAALAVFGIIALVCLAAAALASR